MSRYGAVYNGSFCILVINVKNVYSAATGYISSVDNGEK